MKPEHKEHLNPCLKGIWETFEKWGYRCNIKMKDDITETSPNHVRIFNTIEITIQELLTKEEFTLRKLEE